MSDSSGSRNPQASRQGTCKADSLQWRVLSAEFSAVALCSIPETHDTSVRCLKASGDYAGSAPLA